MPKKLFLILAAMITAVITAFLVLGVMINFHKPAAKQAPVAPEEATAGARPIYAIPENAIPGEREIQAQIDNSKAVVSALQKAPAARTRTEKPDLTEPAAEEPAPPAAPKAKSGSYLPPKEEVRFPTFEERRKTESRGGFVTS
jgi:hypothetical protein